MSHAKERNIDFIICDHHRPGKNLPEAIAVLDPKETTVIILMMNCVDAELDLN
jgi:single-stranded DNA-specific DHH superfamily exonuclease